jgi:hypothetical protein
MGFDINTNITTKLSIEEVNLLNKAINYYHDNFTKIKFDSDKEIFNHSKNLLKLFSIHQEEYKLNYKDVALISVCSGIYQDNTHKSVELNKIIDRLGYELYFILEN